MYISMPNLIQFTFCPDTLLVIRSFLVLQPPPTTSSTSQAGHSILLWRNQGHPAALILIRRLDGDAQLLSSEEREVRCPDELLREENNVGFPSFENIIRLLGCGDETDSADRYVRIGLFDSLRERNLIR